MSLHKIQTTPSLLGYTITQCEDLREYFEYDRDYPDDDRICSEVKDLKVS